MNFYLNIEYWLLGLALAVDCFSVSVAAGIASRKFLARPMSAMAISFGVFQGGMTLIGYEGTAIFSSFIGSFDHWIAFGLLLYLGIRMMREGWGDDEENDPQGKTGNMLSAGSILTLSVATSIDALAVGISLACSDGVMNIMAPVRIIALCSTLMSVLGLSLGIRLGKIVNLHAEILGGIVLICIGIKVLIEHLYG